MDTISRTVTLWPLCIQKYSYEYISKYLSLSLQHEYVSACLEFIVLVCSLQIKRLYLSINAENFSFLLLVFTHARGSSVLDICRQMGGPASLLVVLSVQKKSIYAVYYANGEVNISRENTTTVVWIYDGFLIAKNNYIFRPIAATFRLFRFCSKSIIYMPILRGDAEMSSSLCVTISLFSGKSNGQ